jgi:hypothetical protein
MLFQWARDSVADSEQHQKHALLLRSSRAPCTEPDILHRGSGDRNAVVWRNVCMY